MSHGISVFGGLCVTVFGVALTVEFCEFFSLVGFMVSFGGTYRLPVI